MSWQDKTIVFDLDGTLVDTAPDLHAALVHSFEIAGLEAVSLTTVRDAIGHGARAMIEFSANAKGYVLTETQLTEMHQNFLTHYIAHIADCSRPFDGIIECLDFCDAKNARLAVCTNKTQALAVEVLTTLGMFDRFHSIVGADAASEKKPSAAHIIEAVQLAGGELKGAVMVGDSSTDGFAAKAAGIPFFLMSYGYLDSRISEVPVAARLDRAFELPAALERLFSRAS